MITRDYGVIYDIAVDSHCRRKGVGTQLFQSMKQWFRERGIKHIELNVVNANLHGQGFL